MSAQQPNVVVFLRDNIGWGERPVELLCRARGSGQEVLLHRAAGLLGDVHTTPTSGTSAAGAGPT